MFIGHYAAALALKPAAKKLNLVWLFLGATFIDLVWGVLNLSGVEHARLIPGFTEAAPLDLYDYPWSHGLVAALGWSALVYLLVRYLPIGKGVARNRAALVMAVAVFSHWILDFITHTPDLPILAGEPKIGLGLWNYGVLSFAVESLIFVAGLAIYVRSAPGRGVPWGMLIFGAVMLGLFYVSSFSGGHPPNITVLVLSGTITNLVCAAIAGWLDARRARKAGIYS